MWLVAAVTLSFTLILAIAIVVVKLFLSRIKITGLSERYVFITGCDTGFGNLLARTLDAAGVNVIAGCLTDHGAKGLAQETSSRLKTILVDITDKDSVRRAFDFTKSAVGQAGLWGLVNNAGVMPNFAPAEWTPVEDFEAACKVNLFGTISVTLTFLPLLRQSRGRLVSVCSVTSNCAYPGIANYVISKAGVKMFTQCIRRELLNSGVTAHTIEPGGFKTNITEKNRLIGMLKKAYARAPPESREFYQGNICTYVFMGMEMAARFTSDRPQSVADAMAHALLAQYPKMRYLVGADANIFFRFLSLLPEWAVDNMIGWPVPYGKISKHFQESCIKEE